MIVYDLQPTTRHASVVGDLMDTAALKRALDGMDFVCHLGAIGDVYLAGEKPALAATVNAAGTANVCDAALAGKVGRVVVASTWEVYGQPHYQPIDEKHPCEPDHPYNITKLAGERLALAAGRLRGLDVVALRLGTAFGTRMRPNSVFSIFIRKALGGEAAAGVDASGICPADGNHVVGDLAGKWVAPLPGSAMTSGYGAREAPAGTSTAGGVLANFHYGIDFSTPGHAGTIVALTDMKIVKVRNLDGTFGTGVTGQTTDGKLTIGMYHMEAGSVKVKEGDTVAAGTPLGTEGATGNVTGRHLHIEFFAGALPNPMVPVNPTIDPTSILKEKGLL